MKKGLILFVIFWAIFSITGCASQKMYYFGRYSSTLYSLEKNQNEESLIKHKQELERIVSESEVKNLPVPPGIYAELGYINLKNNNPKEAVRLFQTESQLYPESKHLMDRLIQNSQAKENDEATEADISKATNTISK